MENKRFTYLFIKPYIGNLILYFLLVCLATIFSISSILSASNFLQILFQDGLGDSSNNIVNISLLEETLNNIYASIIVYGKKTALLIFGGLIFFIYLFKDIFTYLASYLISSTRNRVVRNIRNSLFDKYQELPFSYFSSHRKGDLISRISNDIIEYDENVLKSIQSLIQGIIIVVLYLLILFYIDYSLTLTVLIMFPILGGLVSFISRRLKQSSKHLQQKNSNLISIIEETISGLRIIKSHTAIEHVNNKFIQFNNSYTRLRNSIYRKVDLASPFSEFMGNIMIIAILIIGSKNILSLTPSLSPEIFIVYLILFTLIIKPAKDIPTSFFNLKKGRASVERFVEILNVKDEIIEPKERSGFNFEKSILFKDLSFSYVKDEEVLKDINIEFEKGKTTAIVGASGSGKSTIINLIPKFYQPTKGGIYIDGINLKDIHSLDIRDNISMVTQDTILFNDTIFNNITFGRDYPYDEVVNASKIAFAHEFIEKLPQGYNTMIGDMGQTLSGGQRQRLSIARAVLRNSEILILDEATSALDTQNEKLVQKAISNISKDKTTIIIAHRLSTIVSADKIIVMDKAQVKETGTHQELLEIKGIYHNLCTLQSI
ncbi:MAG: ABC transporter ATP-binding protein [Bacteroidales bacterium]|nr:ABC transporter ATP-binding protein [Bacteroidales bacterium]